MRNLKSDDLHIVEQAIYELYGNVDYKKLGLRGRKASPLPGAGMDSPLIFKYEFF
ncbi:hypothetical protein [Sulfuracidifex metallicus]|uniref:hypothetical protein n=1 Tax=Sulfuracidifex metallicus TaxID=47303 RepID=UPI001F0EC877|nr:hypothetical protein [Sulfuracidifex metallicus]WOE51002.1 hypothetical protein RQ359_000235 [Sulfuracidifex metallicus DSM 6482 = JCM 9184]